MASPGSRDFQDGSEEIGCDHPITESQNCIGYKKALRTLNSTNSALPSPPLKHVTKSTYLFKYLHQSSAHANKTETAKAT